MEQDKKFKCDKCGKTYKFKSILLLHSMRCDKTCLENEEKDNETQIEPKQKLKGKWYTVIFGEDSSQKYQCNKCKKEFNTLQPVSQHYYRSHKEMKSKCDVCEKVYKNTHSTIASIVLQINVNRI